MKRVAAMLRGEARDLMVIGEDDALRGRYADALRDGARELEVHLREVAGRYERVHGHLAGWAGELEGFQGDAGRILRAARADAEAAGAAGASVEAGSAGGGSAADDDPAALHRKSLARVEAQRDERAAHYAAVIRREINDTIRDSWWERRKNSIAHLQGALSLTLDVMSWVATGIALAAIILTPAGWVAGLAIWLAAGVLAGHTLLALAGPGSWADVAMDVFGLLTMGIGNAALSGLRTIRTATKLAAEAAAEERAAASAARTTQSVRDRTSAVVNRRGATRAARAKARHDRNIARAATLRAGRAAAAGEAAAPMAEASRWEAAVVGGEKETANLFKDVKRMREQYPESRAVQRASEGAEGYMRTFRGTWFAATAVDLADQGAGSSDFVPWKPDWGTYDAVKGRYTKEVGTKW